MNHRHPLCCDTAKMGAALVRDKAPGKKLYLFDTFEGMPEVDAARDLHARGDFADTSLEAVERYVGAGPGVFRKGRIPETFAGLESARIALAHIDVDIYRSVMDCLEFIWPRLTIGGFVVLDDYGFPTCPGARAAANEFFADKPALPLCLPTAQRWSSRAATKRPDPLDTPSGKRETGFR